MKAINFEIGDRYVFARSTFHSSEAAVRELLISFVLQFLLFLGLRSLFLLFDVLCSRMVSKQLCETFRELLCRKANTQMWIIAIKLQLLSRYLHMLIKSASQQMNKSNTLAILDLRLNSKIYNNKNGNSRHIIWYIWKIKCTGMIF